MNVLVTGGEGYIGKEICNMFGKYGITPIVIDTKLGIDLRQESLHAKMIKHNIKHVIHLASYIDNPESIKDPWSYYDNNIRCTLQVLNALKEGDRIVFSSSAAVYGAPWDYKFRVYDSSEHSPKTPYAHSKSICERIIEDCCKAKGIDYVILRYFNVAGNSNPSQKALIPTIIRCLKNNEPFSLFGIDWPTKDQTALRDFIHVEDVAMAHLKALSTPNVNKAFNIGSGCGYTIKEVIDTAEKITGKKLNVNFEPRRKGDIAGIYAITNHAEQELGFKAIKTLEEIVSSEWERAK